MLRKLRGKIMFKKFFAKKAEATVKEVGMEQMFATYDFNGSGIDVSFNCKGASFCGFRDVFNRLSSSEVQELAKAGFSFSVLDNDAFRILMKDVAKREENVVIDYVHKLVVINTDSKCTNATKAMDIKNATESVTSYAMALVQDTLDHKAGVCSYCW